MSDITFKNVATLMTCIMKYDNKLYLQPVSKEDCFLNKQDNNMWWKTYVRKILVPEKAFSYIKKYLIKKKNCDMSFTVDSLTDINIIYTLVEII